MIPRDPPKLTPPQSGEEIGAHLRKFCAEMTELTAWMRDVAEFVERAVRAHEGRRRGPEGY